MKICNNTLILDAKRVKWASILCNVVYRDVSTARILLFLRIYVNRNPRDLPVRIICLHFMYYQGMEHILSIIRDIAVVPSFSSYEDRIHPVVRSLLQTVGGLDWHAVADNNLVVCVPGDTSRRPVALSAHLDKINHFGDNPPAELPFHIGKEKITGQMDNAAGLAICIALAQISREHSFPPLMLLFSEMEENFGLKHHPHLLKNGGSGLHSGMGAERISRYLQKQEMLPSAVVTIDTTPLFKGDKGVALYSGHWQFTGKKPDKLEKERTEAIVKEFFNGIRVSCIRIIPMIICTTGPN